MRTRGLWFAGIAALGLLVSLTATSSTTLAQSLSSPSFSNASSANESAVGLLDNPSYQRLSATQTVVPPMPPTTFTTRYYGNASADCGALCTGKTETLNSDYTVSWTATAPNIYRMQIDTRRTAGLTVVDEGTGNGQATMGGLTCTPSGGTVVSGDCALANPADANSNSTVMVNVNQTNSLVVCGQSLGVAKLHSMRYVWTQSAVTPTTGFLSINSDEGAVRLGANNLDGSNTAANYPGAGTLSRTQSNDGHFTTVTITNLCGNGAIDSCGADTEQCDDGLNNGLPGSCCNSNCTLKPSGTGCRVSAGPCDAEEVCNGISGACPADVFLPNTTVCRAGSAGEICDQDEFCTGSGPACPTDLVKPNGTTCRAVAGGCDVAETCDGVNKFCPIDGFVAGGTTCRASAGACDLVEQCSGFGPNCPADAKSTAVCRASGGVCDLTESCDGVNNNCPADAKSTAVCRAAGGVCDVAEVCDGLNNACPSDAKVASGTQCRASAGICDVAEQCNGVSNACPANSFVPSGTECRAAADICDVAESCTGSNANCPADAFLPATTVCRASSAGEVCDIPELCTGSGAGCPADVVEPASTVCRASSAGEVCDIPEFCDGTNKTCPADAVEPSSTVCRASSVGEACDVAENCDGTNKTCPADAVLPNGTTCRGSAGICDVTEACDGSSKFCPSDAKSTAECRASARVCDAAESCDGVGNDCPMDGFVSDGTNCDDSYFCNGTQTCTGGVCGGGTSPCGMGQSCDESTDLCFTGDCPVNPVSCRTAQKNKLLIKNKADNTKDKVIWKWTKGAATTQGEFGDPVMGSATYALCFYAGATPALLQGASVPPGGGKWAAIGTKGYKYKDNGGTNAGIAKIIVKGGAGGKSKALVKGKGVNLPDFDSDLPVATSDLPMIVQLRNNQTGICWEGSFNSPKKNLADQFSAKNP